VIDQIKFVQGDIRDAELVDALVSQVDLVVHFAAETHNDTSLSNPLLFYSTNVLGTQQVASACARHDVRLHFVSTDEVFGDLPLESTEAFTRESSLQPSSPYAASKAAGDLLVKAWMRSFGLKVTLSNSCNNYGPNQNVEKLIPKTMMLASNRHRPQLYGSGSNIRSWIHVDDHTDGLWAIIEGGVLGERYLISADCEVSNLELVRFILAQNNLPSDFIEFTDDRPGHDRKYSLDSRSTWKSLGWWPPLGRQRLYEFLSTVT
jgi:dTDP-glucose 4,6-dehydratase